MSASVNDFKDHRFRIYSASTLGEAIRHYRTKLGISQAELAARTGMPRNYVNALEILRELGVRMTLVHEDW